MLRKLISVILAFIFVFALAAPAAFAANPKITAEVDVIKYNNSYLYTERTANWYLCIWTNDRWSIDRCRLGDRCTFRDPYIFFYLIIFIY